ncbi:MAG: hypothetical protein JJ894_16375 [Dinoroseobacter sp.]|nr:hypothetical protein [Dinoroseobacter sp.]
MTYDDVKGGGYGPSKSACVADWLHLHHLACDDVIQRIACIHSRPNASAFSVSLQNRSSENKTYLELECALQNFILPSFEQNLIFNRHEFLKAVSIRPLCHSSIPSTRLEGDKIVVSITWSNTLFDCVCLAHEMGHALQFFMSERTFVPPMVREKCAFVAELAVIRYLEANNITLAEKMKKIWNRENYFYINVCSKTLMDLCSQLEAEYDYDMNYPLARSGAYDFFHCLGQRSQSVHSLFSEGACRQEA